MLEKFARCPLTFGPTPIEKLELVRVGQRQVADALAEPLREPHRDVDAMSTLRGRG